MAWYRDARIPRNYAANAEAHQWVRVMETLLQNILRLITVNSSPYLHVLDHLLAWCSPLLIQYVRNYPIYLHDARHYLFSMSATTHHNWKPFAPSETWERIMMQWLKASWTWEDTNTNDIYDECVQLKFVVIFQMRCCVIRAILTDVNARGSMHHSTILTAKNPTRCNSVSKFLLFLILNEAQRVSGDTPPIIRSLKLNRQPLVLHTWNVVGRVVVGPCQVAYERVLYILSYATWQRPTTTRPTTFHVCKTKGCLCSFMLLMMSGVTPETCWASSKE
jgi:hypothetical protein